MPAKKPPKTLQEVVEAVGTYPAEAYAFVQQGLNYTVQKIHGEVLDPEAKHHVSGAQLCEGLRLFALQNWGLLARTVLSRWNIHSTTDFGKIVFAMVKHRLLQKTDQDDLKDFENVYDFRTAFETQFKINPPGTLAGDAAGKNK